jgi:hypothetical protein
MRRRADQNFTVSLPDFSWVVKFSPTGLGQADRLPNYDVKERYRQTGFVAQVESLDQWSVVARLYDCRSSKIDTSENEKLKMKN